MLILFPPRACVGAAKPDKKAKCLLCICFLSNFRAKKKNTRALLSERRDCVFLFLRLQKYISTHKQRPAETKVISISLSCRSLPFAGEIFSRGNLKNAGNLQPKLRPKPAKKTIWDSRHDRRLRVGVQRLQTCERTCSKCFTRLLKCFSLSKVFRLLNFSATPRGLAAMSDGAGMSAIPAAGEKKTKNQKGLFLQGSFQQVLQQPAHSVSQCATSYAAGNCFCLFVLQS